MSKGLLYHGQPFFVLLLNNVALRCS